MDEVAKKIAVFCVKNELVEQGMFEWCVYSIEKKTSDIFHMGSIDFYWSMPVWIPMCTMFFSWISCAAAQNKWISCKNIYWMLAWIYSD